MNRRYFLSTIAAAAAKPRRAVAANDKLTIACGKDSIRVVELQREGKKPMNAADFLRGTPLKPPLRLG